MFSEAHQWVMTEPAKPLERRPLEVSPPPADHVVVQVAGCGVCHTDLGFLYDGVRTNQPLPLTLGHEISGRVVATGDGAAAWQDRTVIVPAVMPCGACDTCQRGKTTICPNQKMPGNDIDGGFATHITVPARGLCPVDEAKLAAIGLELADVSVVADAVTTPYQAVLQAEVTPGTLCVVIGVGGVGGYCAQIAAAFGGTVVALDVDDAKLAAVAPHGAAKTINVKGTDPRGLRKEIAAFAKDNGLPSREWVIFECSGTAAGQQTAWSLLVHGATLAVVGFTMDRVEVRLSNLMAFHARALGNWGCPPELYPGALDLILDRRIELGAFIERHPLAEINRVFEDAHAHRLARRAILVP